MALSYKARRRWSLVILLVGLPAYVVLCVTMMNWLDERFGRQSILVELVVYVGLGILWALPFRAVFRGVGQADPEAPSHSAAEKGKDGDLQGD